MFQFDHQLGTTPLEKHAGAFPQGNGSNSRHISRHSTEVNVSSYGPQNPGTYTVAPNVPHVRPTSLQMSYSTNDLPTAKTNGFNAAVTPPKTHAEKIHGHNASLGRVPPATFNGSQINDTPTSPQSPDREDQSSSVHPLESVLQASAAPFGPQLASPVTGSPNVNGSITATPLAAFPSSFYGYGIQPYVGSPLHVNGQLQSLPPQVPYNPYATAPYATYPRFPEVSARPGQPRRSGDSDSAQFSRFTNVPLEQYQGELYGLCKDQHGCRYLQRKLEERNPEHVQLIFLETHMHVVELMTGKRGNLNYLRITALTIHFRRPIWELPLSKAPRIFQ